MSKIYSRKRFILKPYSKLPHKPLIIRKRTIKILITITIFVMLYEFLIRRIEPMFETICEDKTKSIATIISNQESTKIMNKYQYEELYRIEKDESGNIVIIKSNVVPINNMISDLTENIQNRFNELGTTNVNISLGSLFGTYFLSGVGPSIPMKVAINGTLDTEIKSEFIAQGINQTLHRIYVVFDCNVKILTPIKNYNKPIVNQVIIAEHIIVGNIPDTYYNLEGMTTMEDTLNVIE